MRFVRFLAVAGLLVPVIWFGCGPFERKNLSPALGFTTIEGQRVNLEEWRGRPVLLAFWASNCRSCLEEMPELAAMFRDYQGQGLRMAAVAMPYDVPSRVVSLAGKEGWPFPVALDPLGQLAGALGVELVPNCYLLDGDGAIVATYLGKPDFRELRGTIDKLLREG
ncbi:TlpA disulfide reductase family protein [Methylococcus capsulatus]|uniref:ResA domain protein n=1 Tax=Methylococcus capsulatus (strain ATCC 33009 / NCIMB 11132 / Bath) TaxID=243233 RepID=Q609H7_METCA|nr:TlpA disulfide reductase family protein [Methylococcus capsulatus]AAU92451.1 resA domain protein [Methylococcus capsulatus str. Bath]QXP90625.1 TlpA family protein disulfide reductase [Methylococcus capsulatus]